MGILLILELTTALPIHLSKPAKSNKHDATTIIQQSFKVSNRYPLVQTEVAWLVLRAVSPSSFSAVQQAVCCGSQKAQLLKVCSGSEAGRMSVLRDQRRVVVEKRQDFVHGIDTFVVVQVYWQNHKWAAFAHSFVACRQRQWEYRICRSLLTIVLRAEGRATVAGSVISVRIAGTRTWGSSSNLPMRDWEQMACVRIGRSASQLIFLHSSTVLLALDDNVLLDGQVSFSSAEGAVAVPTIALNNGLGLAGFREPVGIEHLFDLALFFVDGRHDFNFVGLQSIFIESLDCLLNCFKVVCAQNVFSRLKRNHVLCLFGHQSFRVVLSRSKTRVCGTEQSSLLSENVGRRWIFSRLWLFLAIQKAFPPSALDCRYGLFDFISTIAYPGLAALQAKGRHRQRKHCRSRSRQSLTRARKVERDPWPLVARRGCREHDRDRAQSRQDLGRVESPLVRDRGYHGGAPKGLGTAESVFEVGAPTRGAFA
ncbi:hypothetical protein KCV07_g273, partial [Aureobasidium melanogenum]